MQMVSLKKIKVGSSFSSELDISYGVPQGPIPKGPIPKGSTPQGPIPQGSIPQGSIPQGSIPQGSIHCSTRIHSWSLVI